MSVPAAAIPSPAASYNDEQLTRFANVSVQGEIIATDTGSVTVIANTNTKRLVIVRKIIINVYTSAAQAFDFESNGAGGDLVYNVAASPGVGPRSIDYGRNGYALPAGEGLAIALGVTGGNAFLYVIEAYQKAIAGSMTPAQM